MAGCAELPIFSGCCNFAEQVLIHIAHEVFVVHVQRINAIHHFCQYATGGDKEHGVLHITAECRIFTPTNRFDKRENIVADVFQHGGRFKVVKYAPTQVLIICFNTGSFADNADAVTKHLIGQLHAEDIGICLRPELVIIQQLHEH